MWKLRAHPGAFAASAGRFSFGVWTAGAGILCLAVVLRAWGIGATFESSDQAAMAYLVRHSFGLRWIFAHEYGPVLPLLQVATSQTAAMLGLVNTEAIARLPVMLVSLAQVPLTMLLVRRLIPRGGAAELLSAGLACAVLPALVSDAHYPWGDHTVWLFTGSLALWASLAYRDDGRNWQLVLAAGGLLAHCLSGLFAFALPVTLIVLWGQAVWAGEGGMRVRSLLRPSLAFVLPCVLALAIITACHLFTGGGQVGRLLGKGDAGAFGVQVGQVLGLPAIWVWHFGYIAALPATIGLAWGTRAAFHSERIGLLAVWAWASILPLTLLADWDATGFPNYYFFEAVYATGILTAVGAVHLARSAPRWGMPSAATVGGMAGASLIIAGAGICSPELASGWTGVRTGWGDVQADSGIKAAGFYVRRHVGADAVVMALHARGGMELPVAEYYCGRKVLAHYDLPPSVVPEVWRRMSGVVDVVIVTPEHEPLLCEDATWRRVCRITRDGRPVRAIYARDSLPLPQLDGETVALNRRYETEFATHRIPVALPAPPGFLPRLVQYQNAIRDRGRLMTSADSGDR